MLTCYIINLDRDKERWNDISEKFGQLGFGVIRISAVNGKELTKEELTDFSPWRYFLFYGRPAAIGEIGCYFSHIKTLKTFLATNETHCFVCEDDVRPLPELTEILTEAMKYADKWDLLRLNAVRPTSGKTVIKLTHNYHICCDLKTASGTGSYLLNRKAAELILVRMRPMFLPLDVAMFYGFPIGIREMTVQPFPVILNEKFYKDTTITGRNARYPLFSPVILRYLTVLPYKIISRTVRKMERIWRAKFFR